MRKTAVLTAVLALAVIVPVASAKIVVGKSIAGVTLGIPESQVVAILGPPVETADTGTDPTVGQPTKRLDYAKTSVGLTGGVVTFIDTVDKQEKTSNGVRVGHSEKQLRKKIRGLKCFGKKKRFCAKGNPKPGGTVTTFTIRKKKVVMISLDLVVD